MRAPGRGPRDLSVAGSYAGGGEGCTGPTLPNRKQVEICLRGMLSMLKELLSWPGPVFKRTMPPKELSGLVLQGNLKAEAQTKAHCLAQGSCLLHWC